jgi:hypothetical protein
MATYNKYDNGSESLVEGINVATDTWRIILSDTAPDVADVTQADAAELATAGGYTVNGNTCAVTSSGQTSGVEKLILESPDAWTGSGAGFTVRYAILWNETNDRLISWWDYGVSQLVAAGDTFTVELDPINGVFTLT